ncbi:MAG: hypothetical protein V4628_06785 [Pseudomonadota bacterium]
MSNSDDKTPIDSELKAYLAGEDGVSATYRQASTEEPPVELDRVILAAAHAAVQTSVGKKNTAQQIEKQKGAPAKENKLRQRLSIAASFMVGVLVTSMYFDQQNEITTSAMFSDAVQEGFVAPAAQLPAPPIAVATDATSTAAPAPAAAAAIAELDDQADVVARNEAAAERQSVQQAAQSAERVAQELREVDQELAGTQQSKAVTTQGTAVGNAAPAPRASAASNPAAPIGERDFQIPFLTGNAASAPVNGPVSSPAVTNAETAPSDAAGREETREVADTAAGTTLEEVTVTGSRIMRADDEFERGYRQSREEWLQEILALGEEAISEVEQLEQINTQLEEEVALFSEAYPDFDLEAELESLEAE